jgi:hypothetical protein
MHPRPPAAVIASHETKVAGAHRIGTETARAAATVTGAIQAPGRIPSVTVETVRAAIGTARAAAMALDRIARRDPKATPREANRDRVASRKTTNDRRNPQRCARRACQSRPQYPSDRPAMSPAHRAATARSSVHDAAVAAVAVVAVRGVKVDLLLPAKGAITSNLPMTSTFSTAPALPTTVVNASSRIRNRAIIRVRSSNMMRTFLLRRLHHPRRRRIARAWCGLRPLPDQYRPALAVASATNSAREPCSARSSTVSKSSAPP